MPRGDMRESDFRRALEKHGIRRELIGYYNVGGACVYARNGGDSRRAQLAYLLKAQARARKRIEEQAAEKRLRDAAPELLAACKAARLAAKQIHHQATLVQAQAWASKVDSELATAIAKAETP